MIELIRMLVGRKRTNDSEIPCITSGRTKITPTKAAIAAAVLRKMSPNPKDNSATSPMKSPVRITARAAPREARVAVGAPPLDRMACPRKKVRRLNTTQKAMVSIVVNPSLVPSNSRRLGAAAMVARMVPLEYSLVISSAPKTPPASATVIMPVRDCWVGSNPS